MSNDNKTLADAQPGGRVTLGDALPPLPPMGYEERGTGMGPHDVYYSPVAYTAEQMRDYARAALYAQPNPAGQVDELAEASRRVISDIHSGDYHGEISEATYAALEAALAARQPVGEPVAVVVPGAPTRCRHCESTDLEWFAHVRAVNDVLHGRLTTHDVGCVFVPGCNECSETLHTVKADAIAPLLAAPPAQAVDLGTGIKAIASERERQLCIEGFSRDSDELYREGELARAATAYVQLAAMDLQVGSRKHIASQEPPFFWPWAPEWWKPVDARHDLVRAGALIAAQIDLLDSQAVSNG